MMVRIERMIFLIVNLGGTAGFISLVPYCYVGDWAFFILHYGAVHYDITYKTMAWQNCSLINY